MDKFETLLGKSNPLLISIKQRGFIEPSEIQEKSAPDILKGHDVIAGASTGSGKTLAFSIGLINNVKKGFGIQGLVLTPTRELAEQIANELSRFSKPNNLNILSIYGGVSIDNQIKKISKADIVVGTPGRILDHINRRSISFNKINTLVLDEADRMLDMGFMEDVEKIIQACPKTRQTLLFSATISTDVFHIARRYMQNPKEISAVSYVDPKKLTQMFYDISDNLKFSLLVYLLKKENSKLVMIFCNTRKNVDFISKNLNLSGIEALPIHGGLSQNKRNSMLHKFHSGNVHVLVATDVAARGLDIKGVSHIYNYDIPKNVKEYIHRIGRTARAGKQGKVINIVASRDYSNFRAIMSEDFKIENIQAPYIKKIFINIKRATNQKSFKKDYSRRHNSNKQMHNSRRSYSKNRRFTRN